MNKYAKHYELLMAKALVRETVDGYVETHHMVPRCIGGADTAENLVVLTGREHFVAHLLLHKMYPDDGGLAFAVLMMAGRGEYVGRTYELLKRSAARVSGAKAAEAMRGIPKSDEHKLKMSLAALNRDPAQIEKIAEANRGRKNSEEGRQRMSQAALNRSPEAKRAIRKAAQDPTRRAKLSKAMKGIRHDVSEQTRQKISATMAGRVPANFVTVACPHCGKEGNQPLMRRWHFDNCKKR